MANAFMVQLAASAGRTLYNGINTVVVWATDSAQAITLAKALKLSDQDSIWTGATVTDLSAAPTDLEGWVFDLEIGAGLHIVSYTAGAAKVLDDVGTALAAALNAEADLEDYVFTLAVPTTANTPYVYTGVAGDTIHDVCDALVVLLNASVDIVNAAYVAATGVLTITGAADGFGDQDVTFTVADPVAADVSASFVGAITESGAAGAALSAQMLNTGFIFSAAYNTGTNVFNPAGVLDALGDKTFTITATLPALVSDFDSDITETAFFGSHTEGGSASAALAVTLSNAARSLFGAFK